MKIKGMTLHAKQRLRERYNLTELPDGKREFIYNQSNSRKVYRIGDIYFVWAKSTHKVTSFLTEGMVRENIKAQGRGGVMKMMVKR